MGMTRSSGQPSTFPIELALEITAAALGDLFRVSEPGNSRTALPRAGDDDDLAAAMRARETHQSIAAWSPVTPSIRATSRRAQSRQTLRLTRTRKRDCVTRSLHLGALLEEGPAFDQAGSFVRRVGADRGGGHAESFFATPHLVQRSSPSDRFHDG
jgi:hypothetical protein